MHSRKVKERGARKHVAGAGVPTVRATGKHAAEVRASTQVHADNGQGHGRGGRIHVGALRQGQGRGYGGNNHSHYGCLSGRRLQRADAHQTCAVGRSGTAEQQARPSRQVHSHPPPPSPAWSAPGRVASAGGQRTHPPVRRCPAWAWWRCPAWSRGSSRRLDVRPWWRSAQRLVAQRAWQAPSGHLPANIDRMQHGAHEGAIRRAVGRHTGELAIAAVAELLGGLRYHTGTRIDAIKRCGDNQADRAGFQRANRERIQY
jgi:hypothetical protein